MGSVVGTYGGDTTVCEGAAQGFTVGGSLYRRIALDACSERGIILVGEEKVCHHRLGSNIRVAAEQFQLPCGSDVRHMKTCPILGGKPYGEGGGGIASLGTAYHRVVFHIGVVAILRFGGCHIGVDCRRVLAVCHDGEGCSSEQTAQRLLLINEHIARAGAHEELHSGYAVRVESIYRVDVVVGCAEEEGVVHMRLTPCIREFRVESVGRCGLRHGVWHIEIGGDAAVSRCPTLALHVGFLCESGVAKVHMGIDDTR